MQVKPRSENDSLGSAFKSMVENMCNATGQIKRAVMILSAAVNNIMASVAESATGATQTARLERNHDYCGEVRQTSAHLADQRGQNIRAKARKNRPDFDHGTQIDRRDDSRHEAHSRADELIADSMVRLSGEESVDC